MRFEWWGGNERRPTGDWTEKLHRFQSVWGFFGGFGKNDKCIKEPIKCPPMSKYFGVTILVG